MYGLLDDDQIHYDMGAQMMKYKFYYGYGMAVLQDNGIYKFVRTSHEDLNEILIGICSEGELIRKFCAPMD